MVGGPAGILFGMVQERGAKSKRAAAFADLEAPLARGDGRGAPDAAMPDVAPSSPCFGRKSKHAAADLEAPTANGDGQRATSESMPDLASSESGFSFKGLLRGDDPKQPEVDPALVVEQIKDVLQRASAVVMPTARSLHVALAAAEVVHVVKGLFEMCEKLMVAGVMIYLAVDGRRNCGEGMIPEILWRLAMCMIVAAVAGVILLLPEGRMMESLFHCAMTARYRAAGRHKEADMEAKRCVGKFVFSVRLFMFGTLVFGVAEALSLAFWLVGFGYSFKAPWICSGPAWFNFWALRPALPSLFSFAVVLALIFRSSRDKFLTLAQTTAKGDTSALVRTLSAPAKTLTSSLMKAAEP